MTYGDGTFGAGTFGDPGGSTPIPPPDGDFAVSVVPDPYHHRMAVTVLGLPIDTPFKLQRVLPDGRVEDVRHAGSVTPTGGMALVDDYDTPTDTPYVYRVTQADVIMGDSDEVTLPAADTFWLGEPNTGLMERVIPAANAIPEWTRESPVGVHRVLGRQDPVVVVEERWWASGDLTLYTITDDQRLAMGTLWALGTTLGFYGPAAIIGGIGRIYIAATTVGERRVSARGYETPREWHAGIVQVAEPMGAATAPVFVRWQDVVAAYISHQAVADGEHSWLDVMTGVPGRDFGPDVGWEW